MKELLALADAARLVRDRRYLHSHAETGFDLRETFRYVWRQLEEAGLAPKKCGRCGITAEIGAGEKCVLLRADMDALPIREETGLPFASSSGSMHACGHDLHTAMLLEAARLLKSREGSLNGVVRLMFQPAEELLLGAADMLSDGLLDAPKPGAAFMLHVLTGLDMPTGTAIVSAPGVSAPAAGMFEVRVQGRGSHGAMPDRGVDPVIAACQTVINLQHIQTRELGLNQPCALTIGMLAAGDTANVLPDKAVLRGSYRAFDEETRQRLQRRIGEIASATAQAFGASAELTHLGGCPTLLNDEVLSRRAHRMLTALLGADKVHLSGELGGDAAKSAGSEDFANVSHAVPSVMIALAAGRPSAGCGHPAHHPCTAFDEAALPVGAAVYAALALDGLAAALP